MKRYRFLLMLLASIVSLTSCRAARPIRIGLIVELSGPFRDLGIDGRDGVLLAVEETNRNGGIDGRPLELIIADCGDSIESATAAYAYLKEKKVMAMLGPMTSAQCEYLFPLVTDGEIPCIGITTSSDSFTGYRDLFFRVIPTSSQLGDTLSEFMIHDDDPSLLAVVYDTANLSYTHSYLEGITRARMRLGQPAPAAWPFDSRVTGFPSVMTDVLEKYPDAVLLIASARDSALLAQTGRAVGFTGKFYGAGWAGTEDLIRKGGASVEGMAMPFFFFEDDSSDEYTEFKDLFLSRYGRDPAFPSIFGYEAVFVLVSALTAAGGSKNRLPAALENLGTFPGVIGTVRFDEYGDIVRGIDIVKVENGQFILVSTSRKAY
jgi:branched-chain amino acid transport system substrate-binding protein